MMMMGTAVTLRMPRSANELAKWGNRRAATAVDQRVAGESNTNDTKVGGRGQIMKRDYVLSCRSVCRYSFWALVQVQCVCD